MQRARPGNPVDVEERQAAALTAAALEGARLLGLTPVETSALLGVPQGTLKAMKEGKRAVDGLSGEAECADALVRIIKRLRAKLGEESTHWRSWLRRDHVELGSKPVELMTQRHGVVKLAQWVDRHPQL